MLDHSQHVAASLLMPIIHFIHDGTDEMGAEAARSDVLQVAWMDELNVYRRTAIPQNKFKYSVAALAGDLNGLAEIAMKRVLHDVSAGFVEGEYDLVLLVFGATRQFA